MQLFVIVILGGVIGVILRSLDAMREDDRRLQDYRISLGRDLIDAYNSVKGVRRTLRAFGFRSPTSGTLSDAQVAEFREQLGSLVETQLGFERIDRELEIRSVFDDPEEVRRQLHTIHTYVADIIRDWEQARGSVVAGAEARNVADLPNLQAFLGGPEEGFHVNVSEPVREIQKVIRVALMPRAPSQPPA